ncbi:endonuclease/exonuclease/phosphatase family protein [Nocardioides marmotae]|uniref:endonuclease/exonuclease/phosphatase family protein n=1 Tax=Nocardioides marmotae TaxID=2663857 RepID=UPI0012B5749B|nr:endonuclease/exonuclease/phosphatase family protein [Nocardioides marmotae]MBC9731750.1 hypothetical protein [Nocardioides marmotae]MTB82872.1 hypothetical protein [Nocardioides marmotae]
MGVPTAVAHVVRRTLATTLVGVLVLGLGLTLAGPRAGVPDGPPAATTVAPALVPAAAAVPSATYRTFTLNVCHCLGPKKAMADVRRVLTLGDAGGLQEFSQLEDRQNLIKLLTAQDWGWYMPTGAGVAIPIVWDRQRFRMIDGRSVMTHGPQNRVTPARYINTVRLRELATGKVFGFINTHTIAQASRDAQLSNMNRIPRLRKHLRMLRQEIKRLASMTEHVFAAGDLNVNYLADRRRRLPGLPTDALGDLVSFDMPLTGSRGPGSLLDYAMTLRKGSGYTRSGATVVRGFNSDHDAVVLSYRTTDLFATGALHNRPVDGTGADRKRIGDRQARAVMNAEPGDLVRLATARLDEPALGTALLGAVEEGVRVQVVLGDGAGTDVERRLAAAVGTDRSAPSWVVRCQNSCLGGSGRMETNVLLVSRAGGTTDLTMVGSGSMVQAGRRQWSSTYVSSDPALYAGYGRIFTRLATDGTDTTRTRVLDWGRYVAQIYPVPDVPRRDPVLRGLAAVGCKNADGLRTGDGRTNVRVMVRSWAGARGKRIAQRLVDLRKRGCDVAALLGPHVLSGVRRTLDRGGVATRNAKVAGNLVVIDGRFGKRKNVQKAWVGGPAWSDRALSGDGVSLVVSERETVRQYLDGFTRTWSHG